ncbi:MAG: molybdopterin-dependent oxidoreductase, partial [Rhodospirillales bacterium]|nr:molybdopterin-dependent oxidoreductase [Rhodospirillales bacterium]
MKIAAWRSPAFAKRLKEKNFKAQFSIADGSDGRVFEFENGKIKTRSGIVGDAEVNVVIKNQRIARELLIPPVDYQKQIDAIKNFNLMMMGPDELSNWLTEIIIEAGRVGWRHGTSVAGGETRYVNNTNGGPVYVYVKGGKIVRMTPIDFDDDDAGTWTINARGKSFTPPRKTSLAPHGLASKSLIYSKDRLLYPMKRVDFDPDGERNCENRGISGYERISWDEALDLISEKVRDTVQTHGPESVAMFGSGQWTIW